MKMAAVLAAITALSATPALAQIKRAELRAFVLFAKDPIATAKFYETVFGFKTLSVTPPNATIELTGGARVIIGKTDYSQPRTLTIPQIVLDVDEFAPYLEKAQAGGGVVTIPPFKAGNGNMIVLFHDPAGNLIELMAPGPGETAIK